MARPRRAIAMLAVALCGLGPRLPAEEGPSPASSSTRVRVTTKTTRMTGRLVSLRDDVLSVEHGSGGGRRVVDVPRSSILGLELSQKPSRKAYGVAIGFLAGLAVALAAGVTSSEGAYITTAPTCPPPPPGSQEPPPTCRDTFSFESQSATSRVWLLGLPIATACAGGLVAPGEKWRATDEGELSLRLAPAARGGVSLSVALSF